MVYQNLNLLFVLALVLVSVVQIPNCRGYLIKFENCPGEEASHVSSFDVTGCVEPESTEEICWMKRGDSITMNATFIPEKTYKQVTTTLKAKKSFVTITIPGINKDACESYVKCPLVGGVENHLDAVGKVPYRIPAVHNAKLIAKLSDTNTNAVIACALFNVSIM